ncbi:MAG: hypothetical protein FWG11_06360 [Promicromonosporaceae bacterium]|nr:hypothetical protein [Promicromonosporaceae bacterium]
MYRRQPPRPTRTVSGMVLALAAAGLLLFCNQATLARWADHLPVALSFEEGLSPVAGSWDIHLEGVSQWFRVTGLGGQDEAEEPLVWADYGCQGPGEAARCLIEGGEVFRGYHPIAIDQQASTFVGEHLAAEVYRVDAADHREAASDAAWLHVSARIVGPGEAQEWTVVIEIVIDQAADGAGIATLGDYVVTVAQRRNP